MAERPPVAQGRPIDWFKQPLAGAVAVASLIVFTITAVYLLRRVSSTDLAWSRRVYVFGALEAIAFAAVGWLFGKEVHRERAEAAEQRAADAEGRADKASEDAATHSQAAAANGQRADTAERRAGSLQEQTLTLGSQLREQEEALTRYRERARSLKQAILSAREMRPRAAAPPGVGIASADRSAVLEPELDALADLAERLNPED